MTYTALSRRGPRIAVAVSHDLMHWRRMGLATFHPYDGIAFDGMACALMIAFAFEANLNFIGSYLLKTGCSSKTQGSGGDSASTDCIASCFAYLSPFK